MIKRTRSLRGHRGRIGNHRSSIVWWSANTHDPLSMDAVVGQNWLDAMV